LCFPHPPHPLPAYRAFISLYKDYINKPDSSVGHRRDRGRKQKVNEGKIEGEIHGEVRYRERVKRREWRN
jgi:hypothetical protein